MQVNRIEIILLWIAGLWASYVFANYYDFRMFEGAAILKPLLAVWIPLALVALSRRAWRQKVQ